MTEEKVESVAEAWESVKQGLEEFRVIIAGSRDFTDYDLLAAKCDAILSRKSNVVVLSGTCRGADKLGERYARERGHRLEQYPADWSLGKKGGPIRNGIMARKADALILFWNGFSDGSGDMLDKAEGCKLKIREVIFKV